MAPAAVRPASVVSAAGAWVVACAALLAVNEAGARWWFARGAKEHARVPQWAAAFPAAHRSFVEEPLSDLAAEMLQPDSFFAGRWQEEGGVNVAAYYIEWRKGQAARFLPFLHNPTVCLPLAGCELAGEMGEISVEWKGLTIPFRAYRFTQRGEDMWVAFTVWDPSRAAPLAKPDDEHVVVDWWADRWREVQERRENQPAQMLTLAVRDVKGDPTTALRGRLVALLRAP